MRVAILSESSADEAALRLLVDAILGIRTEPVPGLPLRGRGFSAVQASAAAIIRFAHYKTDAQGLVIVVDSNHTSLDGDRSRLHVLNGLAFSTCQGLASVAQRPRLRVAVGVASPAIEAWLLCKRMPKVDEAAWERGLLEKREPYSKQTLKRELYKSDFTSLERMTRTMCETARGLAEDLTWLETRFPIGFGTMAGELRKWRSLGN